jgi:hypothetical protein
MVRQERDSQRRLLRPKDRGCPHWYVQVPSGVTLPLAAYVNVIGALLTCTWKPWPGSHRVGHPHSEHVRPGRDQQPV